MRIHVTAKSSTTVSIDDELMALLGAVLVQPHRGLHGCPDEQLRRARQFVHEVAKANRDLSSGGLSRVVQRAIFRRIAPTEALAVLDGRYSPEAQAAAAAEAAVWKPTPAQAAAMEERRAAKQVLAARREKRRTDVAVAAVSAPGVGLTSHEQLMRAGAAILARPKNTLKGT